MNYQTLQINDQPTDDVKFKQNPVSLIKNFEV